MINFVKENYPCCGEDIGERYSDVVLYGGLNHPNLKRGDLVFSLPSEHTGIPPSIQNPCLLSEMINMGEEVVGVVTNVDLTKVHCYEVEWVYENRTTTNSYGFGVLIPVQDAFRMNNNSFVNKKESSPVCIKSAFNISYGSTIIVKKGQRLYKHGAFYKDDKGNSFISEQILLKK